jgi:hypothetical protein
MRLTRGGCVQRPLMCGPSGWLACPTLQPPMSFLGGDDLREAVEWNLSPRVRGGRTPWLASHVARPADQHLVNY